MAELVLPSGAIKVIQTQQNMVGGTIAGGAAAVSPNDTDKNSELNILQQIKEVTLNSFKKTTQIAKTLLDTLNFEKKQKRLEKDAAAEILKEEAAVKGGGVTITNSKTSKETKGKFDAAAFAMGQSVAPIFGFIKKIGKIFAPTFLINLLGPLGKLFGKGGFLFRFLGPLGPIGLIIGGVALLFKYSDEIVKALTPAIDGIKKLAQENAPLITALKNGFDFLFKNIIGGIGRIIGGIIEDIGPLIGGFTKLLQGDIMGGFKDIGTGLLNIVLFIPRAIARFFEPVLAKIEASIRAIPENIANFFTDLKDQAIENARNNIQAIKDLFTGAFNTIKNSVTGIFSSIGDFFSNLVDNIKSFINNAIDSLPLPDFLKKKLKLETRATKEADERISETGVKSKYIDENISGMERERMTGGGATMGEGFAEAQGEKYGTAKITQSGTAGYDSAAGILTPKQMTELNSLKTTDEQMAYLKSLDEEEQKRREMILRLRDKKIAFDKQNADYIKKYKVDEPEFMSPDDQMLQDSKFQRQAKNQAKALVGEGATGGQTIIVNNQPTTVTSQNDIKKADMYSGNINTSSGDDYFERNIEGYA
jgi:hypothetical protein